MSAQAYDLNSDRGARAVESGLAAAQWYHSDIPRPEMKALMARSDGPALRDTAILFGVMAVSAIAGIALWGSWAAVPFWLVYGVMYGSAMDSRWHECGHGTAFRTQRYNDFVYQIACFCMLRNPVVWRWSHARHHTDTIIVGRDPEIVAMRPPALLRIASNFLGLADTWAGLRATLRLATSGLNAAEQSFVPQSEQPVAVRVARLWCAILGATVAMAVVLGSWIPLMLIGLPRLYGAWHHVLTGVLQHAGLAEDVLDHRLNSRTVLMNPVSRFIYWNMNYHVEHHMFPMVPYHRLPDLHARIAHDLPAPSPSMLAAYAEVIPALLRQLRHETHFVRRALPATARPYRAEFHETALGTPAQ